MNTEILEMFNVMLIDNSTKTEQPYTGNILSGVVTNFVPNANQTKILKSKCAPLDVKTLFGREERENADIEDLMIKQFMHYIEVYGLNAPGLFNLEVNSGTVSTLDFIKGVNLDEFGELVRDVIYSNAPVKDGETLIKIIETYNIAYDINKILNNEIRVGLFDAENDVFTDGDDVVRYMCFKATKAPLLIKSKDAIAKMQATKFSEQFLEKHAVPLSQVFNRHKRLIMAVKTKANASVINKISRWSKTRHVPVVQAINKTFIFDALNDKNLNFDVLGRIGLRDKFKYLNLLEFKKERLSLDLFQIRNGKVFLKGNRKIYDVEDIDRVLTAVLNSIQIDLSGMKTKSILVDERIDYGLPISRKQTVGQLPFGTKVSVDDEKISSGIYWHNDGGATDLDLSTIERSGSRVGWGAASGYGAGDIIYSGDVTSAHNGAMEFMTSEKSEYGLFVSIFMGDIGSEMELVVGQGDSKTKWIKDPVIREKYILKSRESIVGFVRGKDFVIYNGRTTNKRVSGSNGSAMLVQRGLADFWTIKKLFDHIGVSYDKTRTDKKEYDHDLSYDKFSYGKLETLLL
jgi:hypothetical protein